MSQSYTETNEHSWTKVWWPADNRDDKREVCIHCLTIWSGEGERPGEVCVPQGAAHDLRALLRKLREETAEQPLVEATREQLENEVKIQSQRAENAESLLRAERVRREHASQDAMGQKARADTAEAALEEITDAVAAARARGIAAQATASSPHRAELVSASLDTSG